MRSRLPRALTRRKATWVHPGQLAFDFERAELPTQDWEDLHDLWADELPQHRVVSAVSRRPPKIKVPTSIFAAAAFAAPVVVRIRSAACEIQRAHKVVEVGEGVLRHVAMHPSETEEWAERERARRARQTPPKPTAKARSKGKKLIDLVGSN